MTTLARTTDPAGLPLLTVLVHPEHDPAVRDAARVVRTPRPGCPWVAITGPAVSRQLAFAHEGVWGWRVQPFAEVVAVLTRKGH